MEYQQLGKTGLRVSRVALGTVELGMDYGFRHSSHYRRPDPQEAVRIVHRALDLGVNLIDTAREYGASEELIGEALKSGPGDVVIASKLMIPQDGDGSGQVRQAILGSIEASLKALRLETIDLMQIHNTTVAILRSDEVMRALDDARQAGKIRFPGASCYGEEVPLAALDNRRIETLQVPFNVLDRRATRHVFPKAVERRVGILVRSAFLRGVLTSLVNSLPERLSPVREAAITAFGLSRTAVQDLSEMALRFCLSFEEVGSIIIGVRSVEELESNIADAEKGALPQDLVDQLSKVCVQDEELLDPQNWQDLI